ncbi:MAG: YbaY family lipoprotein [Akkermansiaceae bacterium]|nr:YbaY family lipoprotein [Armatimonadota bacterium]
MNRSMEILMMIGLFMTCAGKAVLAQEQKEPSFGMVTGTVAYLQRIALSPDATLRVRLEDVSRQDVASRLIAEVVLPTAGKQVPLAFAIPYRRADILDQNRYQVRATLLVKDRMLFTTTTAYPVITGGSPSDVALIVRAVAGPAPTPVRPPSGGAPAGFMNTVWKVRTSRQVAPGQLYTFLSDGTLVIASKNSKPAFGSWTFKNGVLTMTEEGRRYPVEILALTPGEFRIRVRNPGSPVEMTLVPARAPDPKPQ